jgi:hypothetical protein
MERLVDPASSLAKLGNGVAAKPGTANATNTGVTVGPSGQRRSLRSWLANSRPQSLLSLPFIYSMCVPLLVLDLWITLYQAASFPLFGIPGVQRRDYFVMDRARLPYLNVIEKFHCAYCSYANGLLSYAMEIAARTEQYWCPIKHHRLPAAVHDRYHEFADYHDGGNYENHLKTLRASLAAEECAGNDPTGPGPPPA